MVKQKNTQKYMKVYTLRYYNYTIITIIKYYKQLYQYDIYTCIYLKASD